MMNTEAILPTSLRERYADSRWVEQQSERSLNPQVDILEIRMSIKLTRTNDKHSNTYRTVSQFRRRHDGPDGDFNRLSLHSATFDPSGIYGLGV